MTDAKMLGGIDCSAVRDDLIWNCPEGGVTQHNLRVENAREA